MRNFLDLNNLFRTTSNVNTLKAYFCVWSASSPSLARSVRIDVCVFGIVIAIVIGNIRVHKDLRSHICSHRNGLFADRAVSDSVANCCWSYLTGNIFNLPVTNQFPICLKRDSLFSQLPPPAAHCCVMATLIHPPHLPSRRLRFIDIYLTNCLLTRRFASARLFQCQLRRLLWVSHESQVATREFSAEQLRRAAQFPFGRRTFRRARARVPFVIAFCVYRPHRAAKKKPYTIQIIIYNTCGREFRISFGFRQSCLFCLCFKLLLRSRRMRISVGHARDWTLFIYYIIKQYFKYFQQVSGLFVK